MAKKKVAAIVKIQIPAGKATPAPPVGTALGPHGVADHGLLQAVQRRHRGPGRHDHPGRDHDLRGPLVHLRPQDPADAGAAAPGGRPRQGLDARRARSTVGTVTEAQVDEIAKIKMPDLNANDLEAAKRQVARHRPLDGHHGRLSATHPSRSHHNGSTGDDLARPADHERETAMAKQERSTSTPSSASTASSCYAPAEALDLVKSLAPAKFDETVELAVRLGVDPRKADQMVRGTVALPVGHRQGRPRRRVRRRRGRRRGPRGRRRRRRRRRPGRPGRGRACSTSTWPSPRPT